VILKGFVMNIRSILAVTDFSVHGDNAMARAALLSAEHGAALKLVCLAYPPEAPPRDATSRLAQHAVRLPQVHGIRASSANSLSYNVDELLPDVAAADLVVWGTAPVRRLRSLFFGQPVEELIRAARRPVLVTRRRAGHPYRGMLVAVGLSTASRTLVDVGLALSGSAPAEIFHAFSAPNEGTLRYAQVSDRAIQTYRDHCRRQAEEKMFGLITCDSAKRARVQSVIRHGDPARQMLMQQQRSGAELIVVGKGQASTFSDLMCASVSSRLLHMSDSGNTRSDLLVVPHGWQPASSAVAPDRLEIQKFTARRVRAGALKHPPGPHPASVRAGA
jgi:nucleotide-binding universal stress UspA family protein